MIREQGVRPDGTDGYGKNEPLRGTQVETKKMGSLREATPLFAQLN